MQTRFKAAYFSGKYLGGAGVAMELFSDLKNEGLATIIVRCKAATVASITLPFVDFKNDRALIIGRLGRDNYTTDVIFNTR